MEKPDNSSMQHLLAQIAGNGVGFRKLFFRMNHGADVFFDEKGEPRKKFLTHENIKMLEIRFSDGEKLLGTMMLTPKMLDKMSESRCDQHEEEYSMHLVNVEKFIPVEGVRITSIELFFRSIKGLYGHTAGWALIDVEVCN